MGIFARADAQVVVELSQVHESSQSSVAYGPSTALNSSLTAIPQRLRVHLFVLPARSARCQTKIQCDPRAEPEVRRCGPIENDVEFSAQGCRTGRRLRALGVCPVDRFKKVRGGPLEQRQISLNLSVAKGSGQQFFSWPRFCRCTADGPSGSGRKACRNGAKAIVPFWRRRTALCLRFECGKRLREKRLCVARRGLS
jgi:hypothetical protein